jgi:AraC family transcriptional activator of pobA
MPGKYIDINSISDLHELYGLPKPRHPLVTVFDLKDAKRDRIQEGMVYRLGFYSIYYKKFTGNLKYGRSYYDFSEGAMMFTAPGQVITPGPGLLIEEGWGLVFHPDLLNRSALGRNMNAYSFFHYDADEALHLSEEERLTIQHGVANIRSEYSGNIDKHTQNLILSNIELLLNYCARFYDRQFLTRAKVSHDVVQLFEEKLLSWFSPETLIEKGLPDVGFFASALHLSPNYLSDLLKRYTGKSTQEHIHLQLVEKAKALLWGTEKQVSEIAYQLGFEHPSHFTKIFKNKTGKSPSDFRQAG